MTIAQTNELTPRKPLRLWPGVVAAVLLLLVRFAHSISFGDSESSTERHALVLLLLGRAQVFTWRLYCTETERHRVLAGTRSRGV